MYIMLICIAVIIGVIFISFKAAKVFEFIAEEKGYNGKSFFWWSFLLGTVGYAMVIALPDRTNIKNIEERDFELLED